MKKLVFILLLMVFLLPFSVRAIEDNPLSHLEVQTKGGTGNFNLSTGKKSFSFTLTSTLDYANIIATAKDDSYVIEGAGKVNCENGMNTIEVVVKDPSDESSVTYTINLKFNRVDSLTDDNGNPRTGSFVSVGLIGVLAIGSVLLINKANKKRYFVK